MPLAFVDGLVGAFFQPFSVAVVVSILLSLLIAFLLIPALAALFFTKLPKHRESGRLTQGYIKLLRGAIARKWIVLTLAVALLAGSAGFAGVIGKSFLPSEPSDELLVRLELPATAMLEQTDEMVRAAEAQLKSREEIRYVQVFAGQSNAVKAMQQSKSGNNTAELAVGLRDVDERSGVRGDLEQSLNKLVQDKYPSGKVTVKRTEKRRPPVRRQRRGHALRRQYA
ncbi:efflux RND transporter permease subunit [Cohnella rhizosphaerae]|uniref:Efflux RND transporter permease subunit n=1 Tax=Cohnella rhizosphaerae TaxID=1457232 RepID=A0A9X4KZM9_9BACL|nr:efflux RND transporter permease subunit [Cohnella rhizosphaerae]MDG0813488.1 efflux RND transporter permease subunit [Cohnella rhizosphaerae]